MGDFGFDDLALLAAIGLVGPLLAAAPGLRLPVIIGELAAGLVIGNTGLRVLDPDEPTFAMLAAVGFALVMFVVGTHVPIHEIGLRGALPAAVARSALIGVVAAGLAVLLDAVFGAVTSCCSRC